MKNKVLRRIFFNIIQGLVSDLFTLASPPPPKKNHVGSLFAPISAISEEARFSVPAQTGSGPQPTTLLRVLALFPGGKAAGV